MQYLKYYKNIISLNYSNCFGWKTKRKLIVFESDDWGAVRMPSKYVYDNLLDKGIPLDKDPFSKFDSLASSDDLTALFEVLSSVKDSHGNHPIITANTLMANPDFNKIKKDNFNNYYFEIFTDTLKSKLNHANSFKVMRQGIENRLFHPQLHGREHVNIPLWMENLKAGDPETMYAFQNEMFGISNTISNKPRKSYMAALDFRNAKELLQLKDVLESAQNLFEQIFGFKSKSFIAPNYVWSKEIEEWTSAIGIRYIQGYRIQYSPIINKNEKLKIRHYLGEKNQFNQIYLVRNCSFEPSVDPDVDNLNTCFKEIENAFLWNKPAIISTHRLNFIGNIVEENRTKNLKIFKKLINLILVKWPDVEFTTSDQLGDIISYSK